MTHTTHTTHTVRNALTAALALLALASAPAGAASREAAPGNWLYVTVTRESAQSIHTQGALLRCDPPGGHRNSARACAELQEAEGDVDRIPRKEGYCTMVYAPVTASARGEWNGRPVVYERTFSSTCAMEAATGAVFAMS
ncbi:SSI family serine proteinase inhibitor [Streptomyces phyllanthi]|uniref:Serine protease n=1 Tax=Streptomyces phyllanthi TaxID=1803180 RepID=A0A5N8W4E7_9ACTN|nr:SSI family serine proteinase inhibitor [Streptomyces phyllanthi]MPY41756.1 serine protease [Streptomyces phyllanthi]